MKKFLIAFLLLFPAVASAQLNVVQGGTGTTTFPANYIVVGSSALRLTAKTSADLGLENALTFNSPLSRSVNTISFLFNTANTWTALNTFSAGATSTGLTVTGKSFFDGGWAQSATSTGTFGIDISGGCFAVNGTCLASGGSGTVTNIATTFPISGGPITTTGTLSFLWGTTSPWTTGQSVFVNANGKLSSVATGTVSAGSSQITVTAGRSVLGGSLAIDCATATAGQSGCLSSTDWSTFNNKGAGTVTSIIAGIGLTGGTITAAGTVALASYFSTTSAETRGQMPYWTSTAGTPATFGTVSTTSQTLPANMTTSGTMGALVGGTTGTLSQYQPPSFTIATSTWVGTTTYALRIPLNTQTFNGFYCLTQPGAATLNIQWGTWTSSTTLSNASSTKNFNAKTLSLTAGGLLAVEIGTPSGSPSQITCTAKITD